ncbi:MAG: AAA family ATPase [Proteobacteria bacterium]|nr:AAA family ATPase [Pseudomonadota bacterium]MBI3497259.1 AAA family ATPase [Pseudomonadota bacterium]
MSEGEQGRIVDRLVRSLEADGEAVERIATHGAMVLLVGDRAYKIKRAVKYPYMDFSTLALREGACRAELLVNRRTAPLLYLDVVAIVQDKDGRVRIGTSEAGEVVEWAVLMRRFDQQCLFDRLAASGGLDDARIGDLAAGIAIFHREATPMRAAGGADEMGRVILGNRDRLWEHEGVFLRSRVQAMTTRALALLEHRRSLIETRRAAGFVRHCHGDLHLGNVALIEAKPVLFDAIEFNPSLAEIDVFYDLGFMLMDLEHRGHRDFANQLLCRYLEMTEDYDGLALLPVFLSVRAAVRAHVGAAAATFDKDAAGAQRRRQEAQRYLGLAETYLDPAPARLVAVAGVSGTGKSSVARALAPGLGPSPGAVVLRSDVVRKRMFGVDPTQRLPQSGYARGVSDRVFGSIAEAAERILAAGHAAIADAVYGEDRHRRAIAAAASKTGAPFAGLWFAAPQALLEHRIRVRQGDVSDADVQVLRSQLAHVAPPKDWSHIDASGSLAEVVARAAGAVA